MTRIAANIQTNTHSLSSAVLLRERSTSNCLTYSQPVRLLVPLLTEAGTRVV